MPVPILLSRPVRVPGSLRALALLTGEQRRRSDLEQERQRIERDWARLTRELGSLAKDGNVAAGNIGRSLRVDDMLVAKL